MGKDLKGKELGVGISQQKNGLYSARFVDKFGKRRQKRFKKLQECRQWIADATYVDVHSNILQATDIMVDAWFDYWIDIKKKTIRPNTVRNYTERYNRNIKKIMGKMLLSEVKPLHCQKIFSDMADEDYRTSTIYQTRIALFNMSEFAKENDVIRYDPCKKSVKSDMGKPSQKDQMYRRRHEAKNAADYSGTFQYWNYYEFICSHYRGGKVKGNRIGSGCP